MSDLKAMFARVANGGGGDAEPSAPKKTTSKQFSIEKTYQKKSQLEHILLRPDTYIGSVEKTTELMWVYDTTKECMVQKDITFVPGLYKIFDEILVNAADNKQRDKNMDCIKIDINAETNTISIWNNGGGIPVVMHKDENMYVPTMIFGHLLTSSNYNDEEEKVTGGRNGYGAKLCNIFSTKFTLETGSRQYKKSFKQTWCNNMSKASEPKIKDGNKDDFTKVTFSPDLTKFKMDKLDDDIVSLMSRRAYDCAASSQGVKVFLNGTKLPVKNFKDYIDLYIKNKEDDSGNNLKVIYEHVNERWEIALTLSDKGFQQVSFVNSIATTKGGRHVDHVVDAVVKQLIEVLKKKNKGGIQIKPFQVKNHMWIFVNCLIVNPTFDSQTKENMTLQAKSFGSKCPLSDKFITGVSKSGIIESVLSWAKFKAQNDLAKTSGKKQTKLKGIPKLEDANDAGTKNAHLCTLILTEGDSAKTLAVSGLSVVGRDHYGVFPLRGKLLNVREASHKQILENVEINALIKIMGLQYKKKYTSVDDIKTLRYGKIMIMTDQDQDGSHIKGLLINFIHHNWPELLRLPFLEEFITPIVKATKKNHSDLSFYSLPEFEEWKNDTDNHHTYNIKYYKGLGTSTAKEAKEYFSDMARHRIRFKYDGSNDDHNITMAFAKKCVDLRKDWLTNHMEETKRRKEVGLTEKYLYTKNTKAVTYSDFVNLELVLFSNADNVRSLPNIIDGFKPGQRKVLFTCIKRNDKREVKVAQLGGSVAEHSAYHHGEVSLHMTIVNLAQNFVGSNNINLLQPRGQFGTRLAGGKDSASPRYIFTLMSPLTRLIFHPHDDALLTHEYDDNLKIEPVFYLPIIPMSLVNGAEGIGTGWMTKIPNFNPRDIISNLRRMIGGDEPKPMHPWYKNFKGQIQCIGDHRYAICGEVSILGTDLIEITELPVGTWTQAYKENVLEPLLHGSEKVKPVITDYKEHNTDTTVRFVITLVSGQLSNLEKNNELHKTFKLISSLSLGTMNGFDENNCLRRFDSALIILQEFYALRLKYYGKRKDYLEGILEAEAKRLTNQARFIVEKCDKDLVIENKKRKAMIEELVKRGYDPDPVKQWKKDNSVQQDEEEAAEAEEDEPTDTQAESKPTKVKADPEKAFNRLTDVKKYGYLLGMSMWMLTKEKKDELLKQRDDKMTELNILRNKKPQDLWLEDLEAFLDKLDEVEEKERLDELSIGLKSAKSADKGKGKKKQLNTSIKSGTGRLVQPIINDDMMKKFAQADRAKESRDVKLKKVKKEMNSGEADSTEIKDEFDVLAETKKKPLKERLKPVSKDGLKQSSIIDFSEKISKGKKKSSDSSSPKKGRKKMHSESSDEDVVFDNSDSDVKIEVSPVRTTKRTASKPVRYNLDSDDDIIFGDEKEDKVKDTSSDSDFDDPPPPAMSNANDSDMLFDSLMGESSKEKEVVPPAPEPPVKPKSAAGSRGKKKLLNNDTPPKNRGIKRPAKAKTSFESSDDDVVLIKQKSKKSKKDSDSDASFSEDSPVVKQKTVSSRARKPVKYALDDSDDSNDSD